jgi:regulator of protease activity HflC (stomatin/prohibitin superfamily)
LNEILDGVRALWSFVYEDVLSKLIDSPNDWVYLALAVWGVLRLAATTVNTGEAGLFFSFGRAKTVLGPGVKLLIPIFQVVRKLPARSRTLHLPAQRVCSSEGLVYDVDANLVYRIVDVRKALIEIDDLVRGMTQALGLAVQELLRSRARDELHRGPELDHALERALEARLEPWGVVVERAGLLSITPSGESLRVTQLAPRARERRRVLAHLPLGSETGLALLGMRERLLSRSRARRASEIGMRRRLALGKRLIASGINKARAHAALRNPIETAPEAPTEEAA